MADMQVMITSEEIELVNRIAKKVYIKHCPAGGGGPMTPEDLKHCGVIGLMEAKRNFDPSMGVPWLKFAPYRIRGAMIDAIRETLPLSQEKQKKVEALAAAQAALLRDGKDVNQQTIAEKLGWTVEQVQKVQPASKLVSIDRDRQNTGEAGNHGGIVLKEQRPDSESKLIKFEMADTVNKCLKTLSPKMRILLQERYLKGLKLRELAKVYGGSIENIRQRVKTALKQMQACLERHGFSLQDIV